MDSGIIEPAPEFGPDIVRVNDMAAVLSSAAFTAGRVYVMQPWSVRVARQMPLRAGMRVLDMCAAPGGKTTHLAALMQGRGVLVANEIKAKRVGHLAQNIERWGAGNTVITNETPEALADHFGAYFDRVLVDAPCSGSGTWRRYPHLKWTTRPALVTERRHDHLRVGRSRAPRPGRPSRRRGPA